MTTTMKMLGLLATAIGAVLALGGAVSIWTFQVWAPPLMPTLYMSGATFALFIVLALVWLIATRRELAEGKGTDGASAEERGLQRLVALAASVVVGVVGVGVIALWNFDFVRKEFVASRVTHVQLEQVLRDPSPVVRLAACEEIFQRGWVLRAEGALISALDPEPAMAVKCLQTARDNDWKGVNKLANSLNDGWTAAMMRSDSTAAPQVCELAPWSPVMSELAGQAAEPRLLHCATAAASEEVQRCCAATIAGRGKLLELLGPATDFPAEAAGPMFEGLVRYSFQPLALTTGAQQVVATLGADDESVRRWVVDLGCGLIDPTAAQPEILAGMYRLIEADSCGLTPEEEQEYQAPASWVRLCEQVSDLEPSVPVQQRICTGVRAARLSKVIDVAHTLVWEATRAPFLQEDAEFIETGLVAAARMGGAGAKRAQEMADFGQRNAVKELRLVGMTQNTCQRVVVPDPLYKPHEVQIYESTDCPRVRDDMTVAEYWRENKGNDMREFMKTLANPMRHERIQEATKSADGQRGLSVLKRQMRANAKNAKK